MKNLLDILMVVLVNVLLWADAEDDYAKSGNIKIY